MKDLTYILIVLAFIVAVIVGGPLVTIWSLNTLFPSLAIPVNIATWAAALWITGLVSGSILSIKAK
jgi:hypothetical protein